MRAHRRNECGQEPRYNCTLCNYKCKLKNNQKRYVCDRCGNSYMHYESLYTHRKYKCGKEPQFHCPHCNYKSNYKGNLKQHIFMQHGPVTDPLLLNIKEGIWKEDQYKRIVGDTNNIRNKKRKIVTSTSSNYIISKDGQIKYPCTACGKEYLHRQSLYNHISYQCGIDPQFACPYCQYKSRHKVNLRYRCEGELEKFSCDRCGRSYVHVQSLYKHRRFECGKEPQFQCPHCPYKAKQKISLKAHLAAKHIVFPVNRHQCSCGKAYKYREGLYNHQRYECGKDPQFPCPKCSYKSYHKGKTYKYREGLYNHQRYECGKQRQFSCPNCPYKSFLKGNLKKHVVVRHSEFSSELLDI
ncbi:hypothetical protein O3M35_011203 [Rhynocoris fuscipes]|uniref:C2H2-type domain-containing protein n=1 Tax=Rhynocoris fuscipes TaxID=488301 RepID=A0AAW1CVF5_9HEMI